MTERKIFFFIGTNAELIKCAPVIKELKKRKIKFKIITTGQNSIFFEDLNQYTGTIKADIKFKEKGLKSSVAGFVFWAVQTLFTASIVLRQEFKNGKKDMIVVHGDTVSALIGAILAKIYGVTLIHLESGLRSFNFFEPFPEEISRFLISKLTDVHFCPNSWAEKNLKNTGGKKINTLSNTLVEPFFWALAAKEQPLLLKKTGAKYFVLIIHRQEHVLFGKKKTKQLLEFILKNIPKGIICIFMVHELTTQFLKTLAKPLQSRIHQQMLITLRLPYSEFVKLLAGAEFIVTDGGSNQEEAYYLGKPCLLLRNCTERIEGLNENVILSKNNQKSIKNFFLSYPKFKRKRVPKKQPSQIIIDYLQNIRLLSWDSQFFGYQVAAINLPADNLTKILQGSKAKLVYGYADPTDQKAIRAAYENKGLLVDEKITFTKKIVKKQNLFKPDPKIVSFKNKKLTSQLISLALQSGEYSRFKKDPNFPKGKWEKLYIEWLRNSIKGNLAQEVFVYRKGNFEAGFITLTKNKNLAKIGLFGVDKKYRRRGIGKKLIEKALNVAKTWHCSFLEVDTQSRNKTASKFYVALGFKVKKRQSIYHFWRS